MRLSDLEKYQNMNKTYYTPNPCINIPSMQPKVKASKKKYLELAWKEKFAYPANREFNSERLAFRKKKC